MHLSFNLLLHEGGFGVSRVAGLVDFTLGFSGFSKSCGFSGQVFLTGNGFCLNFGYCSKNVQFLGFLTSQRISLCKILKNVVETMVIMVFGFVPIFFRVFGFWYPPKPPLLHEGLSRSRRRAFY